MTYHPFIVQRPSLFSINELERIEEAMLRILEGVGIAVLDDEILEQLHSHGFQIKDNRLLIDRKLVSGFLDNERKSNGDEFSEGPKQIEPSSSRIELSVGSYSQHVHDIATDKVVPFTTERLIEATKLLDALSLPGPPGCPADVPPPLQPIVQYWVGATYSRHRRHPVDPKSEAALPYVMGMAEALGHPLQSLPVYVFSPLTLGGESLKCVLKFKDRLSSVNVSDMASAGCSVPINIGDAAAVSVAEVVGSAVLLRELTDLSVRWSVRLCPTDMHSMAMVLGSPEDCLLQLVNSEINAYFHGTRWNPALGGIHTNAKLPGPQACVEKSCSMIAGALLGARRFGVAGTLSLDEVFSAEQLLYDLEIRDHVQRLVEGIDGDCDPERCLRDVMEGLRQKCFVGIETTLNNYRRFYWHPRLFERQFLAAWETEGAQTIRQRAHTVIWEILSQYEYEVEQEVQKELDRVLERAKAEFDG